MFSPSLNDTEQRVGRERRQLFPKKFCDRFTGRRFPFTHLIGGNKLVQIWEMCDVLLPTNLVEKSSAPSHSPNIKSKSGTSKFPKDSNSAGF